MNGYTGCTLQTFVKSHINLSRNSVRFESSSGNLLPDGLNSGRFYLTAVTRKTKIHSLV